MPPTHSKRKSKFGLISYWERVIRPISLWACVLCDGLGSLWDGVLGEFSWKEESHCSLDLSWWESVLLVVSDKLWGLKSNLLEDVINEWVHDAHWFLGDSSFWVYLLEDSVDVDWEGFSSLLVVFLVLVDFLGSLCWGGWHI